MKKVPSRLLLALISGLACNSVWLRAQTAPAQPTDASVKQDKETDEEIVSLSPFVVSADEDKGYLANATAVGGRVRTDLKDIASSISVVTQQFLQDTKAVDNQTLLKYTTNTEVGGIYGNFAGIGNTFINGAGESVATLVRPNGNTRVRGLDSADNTRDLVKSDIPWNGFNVGRVDFQRGANSILFGLGSPAGIINASTNTAGFRQGGSVENQIASFGSFRQTLDYNYVLVPKTLAIRVDAVYDDQKFRQQPAFNKNRTVFGALRWDPKLFGESSTAHTSIRVNYEHGKVNANRPRILPPIDRITPWFDPNGLNKRLVEQNYDYQTGLFPWHAGKEGNTKVDPSIVEAGLYQQANNWVTSASLWSSNPTFFYSGSSTPILATQGSVNLWYAPGHSSAFPFSTNPGINDFGGWAANTAIYGRAQGLSAEELAKAAGGDHGLYKAKSIADPKLFDFYNNLLDGPTKKEGQGWEAYNITIEQSFFDNRLSFQALYDRQKYHDNNQGVLGWSPAITVDIAQYGPIWSPAYPNKAELNANAGRAYVSGTGFGNSFNSDRESWIFTGTGELRASDFLDSKSWLARILGHHTVTGVYNSEIYRTENRSWNLSAATIAWADLIGSGPNRSYDGQYGQDNAGNSPINNVFYLSPNLANSDGKNVNLPRIMSNLPDASSMPIRYFDAHWAKSTNPADPNYVDPKATWTDPATLPIKVDGSTQAANPENLVGWRTASVPIYNASKGDIEQLYTNGAKVHNKITSKAGTWQAYLFDDTIVATVGYRKDSTETRTGKAPVDQKTKLASMNFGIRPLDPATGLDEGTTTSWGVVARLPKFLRGKLPWGTDIALGYSNGKNTRVENRYGFSANRLPDTKGHTKDISLVVTALNDRLSFKVTHYDTFDKDANISSIGGANATLGNGTGNVYQNEAWGTVSALKDLAGLNGDDNNTAWFWNWAWAKFDGAPGSDYLPTDADGNANPATNVAFNNNPETIREKAAIASWLAQMKPQYWYDLYGYPINVAKAQAGDYMHAVAGWKPIDGAGLGGADGTINGVYPTGTIDNRSTGWEFEVTGKPMTNLDVSLNASKQFARQVSLGKDLVDFMYASYEKYMSPAGDIRQWWAGDVTYRQNFLTNIWSAYQFVAQTNGKLVPEMSPWRANLSATYHFDSGRLKGAFVGGSYRWEQGTILGYHLNDAMDNLDVNRPIWSKSEDWVDLWAGYEFKLTSKVNLRTQINLRDVGKNSRLRPISVQPDGAPGQYRVEEGMTWLLSNTLSF